MRNSDFLVIWEIVDNFFDCQPKRWWKRISSPRKYAVLASTHVDL